MLVSLLLGSNGGTSCTIPRVVAYVDNVKSVRAFGLFLKIAPGKLDAIEKCSIMDKITQIVQEWFRQCPKTMCDTDRWEELGRVLLEPAVYEPVIANKLRPHFRRGSSVDSAISVFSSRSPSPTLTSPPIGNLIP